MLADRVARLTQQRDRAIRPSSIPNVDSMPDPRPRSETTLEEAPA
jgi:hypothetical protein